MNSRTKQKMRLNVSLLDDLEKNGHTFDIKQPFEGTNDKFEIVLKKTYQFFNQNLH
jgi:hypothetical protein